MYPSGRLTRALRRRYSERFAFPRARIDSEQTIAFSPASFMRKNIKSKQRTNALKNAAYTAKRKAPLCPCGMTSVYVRPPAGLTRTGTTSGSAAVRVYLSVRSSRAVTSLPGSESMRPPHTKITKEERIAMRMKRMKQ